MDTKYRASAVTRRERVGAVARTVASVVRERRVSVTAAGLAYYAFNSLIPAAVLLVVGVSAFEGFVAFAVVLAAVTGVEASQLEALLREFPVSTRGLLRATAIAGGIFLWSTGRLFQEIQRSFAAMYGSSGPDALVRRILEIAMAFTTLAVAVVLTGVVGVSLSYVFGGWVWALASPVLLFVALLVVFLPMYVVFPGGRVTVGEALPGATLAAGVWAGSGMLFRIYARSSTSVELFGVAGGVLLVLTWIYLGGYTLIVGVALNAVAAGRIDPQIDDAEVDDR